MKCSFRAAECAPPLLQGRRTYTHLLFLSVFRESWTEYRISTLRLVVSSDYIFLLLARCSLYGTALIQTSLRSARRSDRFFKILHIIIELPLYSKESILLNAFDAFSPSLPRNYVSYSSFLIDALNMHVNTATITVAIWSKVLKIPCKCSILDSS